MKQISVMFLALSLGVYSLASARVMNKTGDPRPNILFIEVDDLTAAYVGFNGAQFAITPNIDALAENGVVFDNAVCQGAMCGPSRNSLITARYPHNFGFYENGQMQALPKDIWTFPKALRDGGYETFWVGKCHIRPDKSGTGAKGKSAKLDAAMKDQMGFDHVYQSAGRVVVLRTAKKLAKNAGEWKKGEDAYADFLYDNGLLEQFMKENGNKPTTLDGDTEYMDGHFTTKTIEQLQKYQGEKPFFMWTNFSCPHGPYDVPEKYFGKFKAEDMPDIIDESSEQFAVPEALKEHKTDMSVSELKKLRAEYSATIHYMDDQVGRIIDFIEHSRYAKNTVIVFFSDHGIMSGNHGLLHKTTLFQDVLNPTLLIYYPRAFKAKRIKDPVELLDLGKTVLEMAGISDEKAAQCPNGYSLIPLLTGNGEYKRPGVAFSEIEGFTSVFDGRFKLIENDQFPILFDLKANPQETINYAEKHPETVEKLQMKYREWISKTGPALPAGNSANDHTD